MIKCCVVLEEYVGIYLFKDQYVVATESFDYGPDVLNSIFNYLKQYNVSVLNVVMSSYLTCEVYREVVVANEYDIEGKNFYEYVPETDVDKIRHLATVAKVPEINFYGSISCDIKLADKAIIVDQVDNMFSVLVVIDGELKATAYCRESNLKSILLNMSMKYQTVNFIDVKNFIDPDKLEFFTNYTMVTELSLLPTLTLCSCILDGCVSSFDSTNISSRGKKIDSEPINVPKNVSSGDSNITEPVAPVLEEDNETATISNLQKVEQKSRTSKISALAVAAMIAISIISGAAFGISKKLGDVNYRIKQSITENESALAEVKAESEKLSVLNYDSILIGDLLSIKVNGCIGYVSMNSEEIEILYYLRDEKSAKTLEDKLTNYKVASIEKSGTLKVEDTECLKYTVKIERSTL